MKTMFSILVLGFVFTAEARIVKATNDLFYTYNRETQGKSPKAIVQESIRDYENFVAMDVNSLSGWSDKDALKPKALSYTNATIALNRAMSNPVVSLDRYSKYDPNNEGIGFCFGRAMFLNTYLAMAGFNRANMKKAFIMGPMSKGAWAWHVTTIVQSKDYSGREIWLALDPVIGKVMGVREWYEYWQGSSDDGKLRLYIAEAGKFAPAPGAYDENGIADKFYHNYFLDMMNWFAKNDVSKDLRF